MYGYDDDVHRCIAVISVLAEDAIKAALKDYKVKNQEAVAWDLQNVRIWCLV